MREPGPRLIGNVAIEADLGGGPTVIAGFENHGGRTYLGAGAEPLGRVLRGHGNNGRDGFEGVRRLNMFGTYLHGPLLPKNAWLADRLIALAIGADGGARARAARRRARGAAHAAALPRQRLSWPKTHHKHSSSKGYRRLLDTWPTPTCTVATGG